MINLDINSKYFLLSFRFNKSTPADFGLIPSEEDSTLFIDKDDNSLWIWQKSYDFGWGNENGFMRLPELNFEQLWYLLTQSPNQDNMYGSAYIIEQRYPDKLLEVLTCIFEHNRNIIDDKLKNAFRILKLHEEFNRSEVLGKSYKEIDSDYKKWLDISKIARDIIQEA